MEEELKQAPGLSQNTEEESGITSPSSDADGQDKKDSALLKSIKDKGAHSVTYNPLFTLY